MGLSIFNAQMNDELFDYFIYFIFIDSPVCSGFNLSLANTRKKTFQPSEKAEWISTSSILLQNFKLFFIINPTARLEQSFLPGRHVDREYIYNFFSINLAVITLWFATQSFTNVIAGYDGLKTGGFSLVMKVEKFKNPIA